MAQDKQISISVALLGDLIICLAAQTEGNPTNTEEQRMLNIRSNQVIANASTLLRSARGPQSFSGNEIGDYHVDPTQSSFI